ncbi:hypothetical protein E8E13_000736 [Curvularia kusanoi]|uniref:Xylanolytic transcriptional activator regulatory domain-containing protein n=1 Tax=Curvularia kusanoi TaxID=90978 RepID=A0A9P4T3J3_CURKU|nr:hypothetical protein E8E13_000736 [Curvularia kusanoi]
MAPMLQNLSRYIQDGNGAFISGGILWWGDLVNVPRSDPLAHLRMIDGSPGLAFYHVCFALSVLIEHVPLHLPDIQTAETYFTRARKLIGDPSITNHALADVPALTLMAFYLIEVNRRDLAAKYVGLAALAASAHGAHRSADNEARKREFWTLFILDRWISMLMGRPPTIMEESIRLQPPADDPNDPNNVRMPPCAGLYANVELARVSGYVVQEVYRVAPRTPKRADEVNADEALRRLHDWLARLPAEFQLELYPDLPRRDPPCCTMHMSYNQLIILTTRRIFFDAIKEVIELAQQRSNSSSCLRRKTHEKYIRVCIEAAQRNVVLAAQMHSTPGRWLQSSLHFLFNAAVILLLDRISSAYDERAKTDKAARGLHREEITFAIDVFRKEAETGTNYQADCCKVLQDLQALSGRCLNTQRE